MARKIEKIRNSLLLVFFLLIISIIFTPLLLRRGVSFLPEEIFESILLFFQISLAWQVFRLYERTVKSREKEIERLEKEYRKRETDLIDAFAYLGKVNVQVSLIKSFLQKLKAPSSRKEAESYITDILGIVLSLSRKKWVTLRAIDSNGLKTSSEFWVMSGQESDRKGIKIGNKEIMNFEKNRKKTGEGEYFVFSSSGSGRSTIRFFLVFPNGEKMERDMEDFFRAAVNQCEVLLTLFDARPQK